MRMNKILSLCCPHQFRQYKNNHQSVSRLKFVIACSEKHYIMIRELTYRFGARFRPNLKRNILSRWWYASQWFAARGKVDQSFSSVGYYALAKAFGSGTLLHYCQMRALALNHEWEIALTVLMKLEPNNNLSQERGESWFSNIIDIQRYLYQAQEERHSLGSSQNRSVVWPWRCCRFSSKTSYDLSLKCTNRIFEGKSGYNNTSLKTSRFSQA